jgi:hypothetical protein
LLKEEAMTDTESLEQAAAALAGNWRKFSCFCWSHQFDEDEDPANWCIVYTLNRDSRLVEQSNAAVIDQVMAPFIEGADPDVVSERHSHWACGWLDGYAIRVRRAGQITPAFQAWCALAERRDDCGLLDANDYAQREYDASIENIRSEGRIGTASWSRARAPFDPAVLPADWAEQVYDWLADHQPSAVENRDDSGGYPTREQIAVALRALGLVQAEGQAQVR